MSTSAYLSSLLTSTTSRYNNLRRALLSDESDGDTEADSHISRVLRAYYVEKGRPFPPWLPPDPHSLQHSASAPQYGQQQQPYSLRQQGQSSTTGGRRGGGLSDLFDTPAQPSQPAQPMSLRRGGGGAARGVGQQAPPGPATSQQGGYNSSGGGVRSDSPYGSSDSRGQRPQPAGARPLLTTSQSQPPGSTGGLSATSSLRSTGSGTGGGTAQDRLKAKLWGAGRGAGAAGASGRQGSV